LFDVTDLQGEADASDDAAIRQACERAVSPSCVR
jgi:hypothetical protein